MEWRISEPKYRNLNIKDLKKRNLPKAFFCLFCKFVNRYYFFVTAFLSIYGIEDQAPYNGKLHVIFLNSSFKSHRTITFFNDLLFYYVDETALDFWYQYYEGGKFLNEMEEVMQQLRPFYEQLHAYIRHKLFTKYGSSVVQPNGLIPDHLYQQVLMQAWKNQSIVDGPYQSLKIPNYDSFVMNKEIDAKKLLEMASNFYESLGFESMPKEFWEERTKEKTDEDTNTIDCKTETIDFTPKTYLRYCQRVDFLKFLEAHYDMGRIYFASEKRQLPAYYFDSYELENPVGQAVILSASSPKHLKTIGLNSNFEFTEDVLLNRLFRLVSTR